MPPSQTPYLMVKLLPPPLGRTLIFIIIPDCPSDLCGVIRSSPVIYTNAGTKLLLYLQHLKKHINTHMAVSRAAKYDASA